ncbi:MAG TPA: DUF6418 domain-containing protein [Flavobacteriaceae bacterium]|nr:DUF6418 domain-containing protein [Flavobacteriaceae bacterium]
MGLYINILFFLMFLGFSYWYAKKSFTLFFLYGLVFFQAFAILPSLIYIEEGILINEQGRFSFYTGATILCVLYFIFTFMVIAMSFKSFNKIKLPTFQLAYKGKNVDKHLILATLVIVQFLLLVNAALSPLPFFDDSVDRFSYWSSSRFPFLKTIFGNTAMFIPFGWGLLFPKYKKTAIGMFFVYLGYNFLIGQKFSPIVNGSFSFLLPIVFYYKNNLFNILKKNIVSLGLIGICLFGIMYTVTYNKYKKTRPFANIEIYDPNQAMLYRIFGLQGHLFWGATERYVVGETEAKSFNPTELILGMRVMMHEFAADQGVLLSNEESGFNFTNAYPAILFKIFPLSVALIFHTFFTIGFLAVMGWVLKEFLNHRALILSLIAYQLFLWTLYAFSMGYFNKLYIPVAFLLVYAIFVYLRNPKYVPQH